MPSCPSSLCPLPLRDRNFSSVDALVDHAKETRALHSMCSVCHRLFKDSEAQAQHMEAKHVVSCESCNRKFKSQAALDQHYRASTSHPSCPVCEVGVANSVVLAEHISTAHPRVRCCGISMYERDLNDHFLVSRNHPKCADCSIGFEDRQDFAEHNALVHPELQCGVCEKHFTSAQELQAHKKDSASHRKCEFCNAEYKDTAALVEHFTATHLVQEFKDPVKRIEKKAKAAAPIQGSPSTLAPSTASNSRTQSHVMVVERTIVPLPRRKQASSSEGDTVHVCECCYAAFDANSALNKHYTEKHLDEEEDLGMSAVSASSVQTLSSQYQLSTIEDSILSAPNHFRKSSIGSNTDTTYANSSYESSIDGRTVSSRNIHDTLSTPDRPSIFSPSHMEFVSRALRGESTPSPPSRQRKPVTPPIIISPAPRTPTAVHAGLDPSSSRSKASVAETPSGDLSNFHLLKGSPLQSIVDLDTPTPSPRTPSVSPAAARLARRTTKSTLSPFYCRVCRADPCVEITATVCGHVFCNSCIVQEVRQTARCPVCNAAAMLFALLRLDVMDS
ncbi:hypothetical protein BV25DRAFT_1822659 [Artomyces pyxidatus]|uniref:Uncharacterized protein n=1 Tax=Artomyces pyxidatus TaxID=48021 RepID=A0ACB8T8S8_9AGAM|nr:hypothetical protein BV25DRAFT_1822659 [Artomyces pyxidatus]